MPPNSLLFCFSAQIKKTSILKESDYMKSTKTKQYFPTKLNRDKLIYEKFLEHYTARKPLTF